MKKKSQDTQPADATRPAPLYGDNDPIPVPDVSEVNTESVWALFPDRPTGGPGPNRDNDSFGETEASPLDP